MTNISTHRWTVEEDMNARAGVSVRVAGGEVKYPGARREASAVDQFSSGLSTDIRNSRRDSDTAYDCTQRQGLCDRPLTTRHRWTQNRTGPELAPSIVSGGRLVSATSPVIRLVPGSGSSTASSCYQSTPCLSYPVQSRYSQALELQIKFFYRLRDSGQTPSQLSTYCTYS